MFDSVRGMKDSFPGASIASHSSFLLSCLFKN